MKNEQSVKPPVFANPPINEVVCGVSFETLKKLLAPHLGLLWEKYLRDYPECLEVVPLAVQIEKPEGTTAEAEFVEVPPLPRVQLLNRSGDGMIQVQRERFHYNWQKKGDAEYPRFEAVFDLFQKRLATFKNFLAEFALGELAAKQYELTYVDHIPLGDGWTSTTDIGNVFPDLVWQPRDGRLIPEAMAWKSSFWMPDDTGRLHASIRTATRASDSKKVLALDLTARGLVGNPDMDGMGTWFNKAHDHIVEAFQDLSSEEMQMKNWGRVK